MLITLMTLACTDPVEPASYLSVLTVNPAHGAQNIPVDSDLRVVFSAALVDPQVEHFILQDDEGTPVPLALRWFEDQPSVLVIDPNADLDANSDYTLNITAGVASEVGELGAPLSSAFATGSGTLDADADTDSDSDSDSDSDADADSDADSDSDADTDAEITFDPAYATISWAGAWQDKVLARWQAEDGSYQAPYLQLTLYEAEYVDTMDEAYTCNWYGGIQIQEETSTDLVTTQAWNVYLTDLGFNDCTGLPPEWGADQTPSETMTGQRFGLGFGPMSDALAADVKVAVEEAGYNYETDWAPYLFAGQLGLDSPEGVTWYELQYGLGFELDEDGAVTGTQLPNDEIEGHLLSLQPWTFIYSDMLLP